MTAHRKCSNLISALGRGLAAAVAALLVCTIARPVQARTSALSDEPSIPNEAVVLAGLFPAGAEWIVAISDAAGHRQTAAGAAVQRLLADAQVLPQATAQAWADLSGALGLEPENAFDDVLGRRMVLLIGPAPFDAQGVNAVARDWAIVSEVSPGTADRLRRLRATPRQLVQGIQILSLEGRLELSISPRRFAEPVPGVLAKRGPMTEASATTLVLLGPPGRAGLFESLLPLLADPDAWTRSRLPSSILWREPMRDSAAARRLMVTAHPDPGGQGWMLKATGWPAQAWTPESSALNAERAFVPIPAWSDAAVAALEPRALLAAMAMPERSPIVSALRQAGWWSLPLNLSGETSPQLDSRVLLAVTEPAIGRTPPAGQAAARAVNARNTAGPTAGATPANALAPAAGAIPASGDEARLALTLASTTDDLASTMGRLDAGLAAAAVMLGHGEAPRGQGPVFSPGWVISTDCVRTAPLTPGFVASAQTVFGSRPVLNWGFEPAPLAPRSAGRPVAAAPSVAVAGSSAASANIQISSSALPTQVIIEPAPDGVRIDPNADLSGDPLIDLPGDLRFELGFQTAASPDAQPADDPGVPGWAIISLAAQGDPVVEVVRDVIVHAEAAGPSRPRTDSGILRPAQIDRWWGRIDPGFLAPLLALRWIESIRWDIWPAQHGWEASVRVVMIPIPAASQAGKASGSAPAASDATPARR